MFLIFLVERVSRSRLFRIRRNRCHGGISGSSFWIFENRRQKFRTDFTDGGKEVYFFFLNMEKLYHLDSDGCTRHIAAPFPDTKTLFVDIIYRYRSGADTFERAILKSPTESI